MDRTFPAVVKSASIAILVGLLFGALLLKTDKNSALTSFATQLIGWPLDGIRVVANLLDISEAYENLYKWIFGPALPGTTAILIAWLVYIFLMWRIHRRPFIEKLWPSVPDVLIPPPPATTFGAVNPHLDSGALLERSEEMSALLRFAGEKDKAPTFITLLGPEGVGKTRLGVEWLRTLKQKGWDVGQLAQSTTLEEIGRIHFRRKTAILIDEDRNIDAWQKLDMLLTKKNRTRIVLVQQFVPMLPDILPLSSRDRVTRASRETILVKDLSAKALLQISPGAAPEEISRWAGRPLYALLRGKRDILSQAEKRWNVEPDERRLIAFAALAGPVDRKVWKSEQKPFLSLSRLEKLFAGEARSLLKTTIPEIKPGPVANEIVLLFLQELTDDESFLSEAMMASAANVGRRLESLWRHGIDEPPLLEILKVAQRQFDEFCPEAARIARARAHALQTELRAISDRKPQVDDVARALSEMKAISTGRPFDIEIARSEARAVQAALDIFNEHGQAIETERWLTRLHTLLDDSVFCQDLSICRTVIEVYQEAISYLGGKDVKKAIQFYERISYVCGRPKFAGDAEFYTVRTVALANLINEICQSIQYNNPGNSAELLADYGEEILRLASDALSKGASQAGLATASANVVKGFGVLGDFLSMENWAAHTKDLSDSIETTSPTQYWNVVGYKFFHLIAAYSHSRQFKDAERWATELDLVAWKEGGAEIPKFRERAIGTCAEVLLCLGTVKDKKLFSQWYVRFKRLKSDELILVDEMVRLGTAICYANITRFFNLLAEADLGELEGVGAVEHIIQDILYIGNAAAENGDLEALFYVVGGISNIFQTLRRPPRLDLVEMCGNHVAAQIEKSKAGPYWRGNRWIAEMASDALEAYAVAGRREDGNCALWRERLHGVACHLPDDGEVQSLARQYGLDWVSNNMKVSRNT